GKGELYSPAPRLLLHEAGYRLLRLPELGAKPGAYLLVAGGHGAEFVEEHLPGPLAGEVGAERRAQVGRLSFERALAEDRVDAIDVGLEPTLDDLQQQPGLAREVRVDRLAGEARPVGDLLYRAVGIAVLFEYLLRGDQQLLVREAASLLACEAAWAAGSH